MIPFIIFLVAAVLFVAFVLYSSVKVVKQTEVYVIERLGKFQDRRCRSYNNYSFYR